MTRATTNIDRSRRPLARTYQWLLAWLFIVYFLLGMVFLVERWAKTQVDEWQDLIAAYLSNETGVDWSIRGFSLDYHRLNPIVRFDRVQASLAPVGQEAKPIVGLSIDDAEIYIDLARSLINRQLILYGARAEYVSAVVENAEGRWGLAGFSQSTGSALRYDVLAQLDALKYLNIPTIHLRQLIHRDTSSLQTSPPAFSIRYMRQGQLRQLEVQGDSDFEDANEAIVEHSILQVIAQGELEPEQYSLQIYGTSGDNRMGRWLNVFFDTSDVFDLDLELVAKQLPGNFMGGALSINSASFNLSRLEQGESASLGIRGINVLLDQQGADRWQMSWPEFVVEQGVQLLPVSEGTINYTSSFDNRLQLSLQMPELNVGLLSNALIGSELWAVLLGEKAHGIVEELSLGGYLDNMSFTLPLDKPADFSLAATLRDTSIASFRGVPSGSGVYGELWLSANKGWVGLDENSQPTSLGFPGIYAQPIDVHTLKGDVTWSISNGRVEVHAPALNFSRAEDAGDYAAALSLNINARGRDRDPDASTMALSISAQNANAARLLPLVPEIAPASLVDWLNSSDAIGVVSAGSFIFNGSLREGDGDRRTISLLLDIEDAGIQYLPDWPVVTQADARLTVHSEEVAATISSANIYSMDAADVQISVSPDPETGVMQLNLNSKFSGGAENIVKLLQQAPVGDEINALFTPWSANGLLSDGIFALHMPLEDIEAEDIQLEASADLEEVYFSDSDLDIELSNIQGRLGYSTASNVVSKSLTGMLWGERVEVTFGSKGLGEDVTEFFASGNIDVLNLERWLDQPLLSFASGKTQVELSFSSASDGTGLIAESQMQGVTLDLPEPFSKAASEQLPMELRWELSEKTQPMHLQLGNRALMQATFSDGKMAGAAFAVSDTAEDIRKLLLGPSVNLTSESLYSNGELRVHGFLSHIDTDPWFLTIERAADLLSAEANGSSEQHQAPELRLSGTLRFDAITAYDIGFGETSVGFDETESRWNLEISNEQVAGIVSIPAELSTSPSTLPSALPSDSLSDALPMLPIDQPHEARVYIDLERLHLPRSALSSDDDAESALLPSELSSMDVTIESLIIGERSLGEWSFLLTASGSAALLHDIEGKMESLSITSESDDGLLWAVNGRNKATSSANLKIKSRDFESFLSTLVDDGTELPMQSKKLDATMSLDWKGYPQELAFDSASGYIDFDFEEGRFYEAPEGATGIMKLLGLINFDTLIRRVQLDFKDVYKEGLSFDEIYGSVHMADKKLSFYEKPIQFEGPSSEFKLTGEIDMAANTIDASLIATLPVANNLPWVGALAGGLPGAAGVYVFTKMFGSQLKKLSSASYLISGPLNDPAVEFDRLFENKNRRPVIEDINSSSVDGVTGEGDRRAATE